jgi:predicted dehydrogenase
MNFAIIGCGAVTSRYHLPALKKLDAEVLAVVDIKKAVAKKIAKKFDIKHYYSNIDDVLNDPNIDTIVIATPTPTHAELAMKAANAGKNIIVEKPLASSLNEGLAVKHAVEDNDIKLTIVQNYRYVSSIRKAREIVLQGLLGDITSVYGVAYTPWPNQWTRGTWLYCEPGVLLDFSPHVVDAILWIINSKPKRVYAVGGDFTGSCGFINYAQVSVLFDNGIVGTIDLSWLTGTFRFLISLTGTSGRLEVDPRYNTLFRMHGTPTPIDDVRLFIERVKVIKDIITGRFFTMPRIAYELFYTDFINAVDKNGRMPVTITEALTTLAILEGAYKSIKSGKPIDINL